MESMNSGIMVSYKRVAPAVLDTPRGRTPKGLASMPHHDTPNPENPTIPYGYCQCGCGQKTPIFTGTDRSKGRIKGQHAKFVFGHSLKVNRPPRAEVPAPILSDDGLTAQVPLMSDQYPGLFAVIDAADVDLVGQYRWNVVKTPHGFYAVTTIYIGDRRCTTLKMHRLILDAPDGLHGDHISDDGLDNRRANLRLATHTQNHHNQRKLAPGSSRFKGVTWHKQAGKWVAQIVHAGHRYHLGLFVSEVDAAEAYDAKAAELFGEFAVLNFPTVTP